MRRWVVGSILHGGPIELFLVPATTLVTKTVICDILAAKSERGAHVVAAAGVLSRYLTPYNRE